LSTSAGDSAYRTCDWLIPPLNQNPSDPVEQRFNRAHKKTRKDIECAYGILKEEFPCLARLRVNPLFAGSIVNVCAPLHNIRSEYKEITVDYEEVEFIEDPEDEENIVVVNRVQQLKQYFE